MFLVNFITCFPVALWCALSCKELSLKLQDCAIMLPCAMFPLIMFVDFMGRYIYGIRAIRP